MERSGLLREYRTAFFTQAAAYAFFRVNLNLRKRKAGSRFLENGKGHTYLQKALLPFRTAYHESKAVKRGACKESPG